MNLRWLLAIVIVVVGATVGIHEVKAAPQDNVGYPCVITIPAQWGDFKGVSQYGLAFEDKNGNIRLIDQMACSLDRTTAGAPNVAVEVHRK